MLIAHVVSKAYIFAQNESSSSNISPSNCVTFNPSIFILQQYLLRAIVSAEFMTFKSSPPRTFIEVSFIKPQRSIAHIFMFHMRCWYYRGYYISHFSLNFLFACKKYTMSKMILLKFHKHKFTTKVIVVIGFLSICHNAHTIFMAKWLFGWYEELKQSSYVNIYFPRGRIRASIGGGILFFSVWNDYFNILQSMTWILMTAGTIINMIAYFLYKNFEI